MYGMPELLQISVFRVFRGVGVIRGWFPHSAPSAYSAADLPCSAGVGVPRLTSPVRGVRVFPG
jgi:hypothetical protein